MTTDAGADADHCEARAAIADCEAKDVVVDVEEEEDAEADGGGEDEAEEEEVQEDHDHEVEADGDADGDGAIRPPEPSGVPQALAPSEPKEVKTAAAVGGRDGSAMPEPELDLGLDDEEVDDSATMAKQGAPAVAVAEVEDDFENVGPTVTSRKLAKMGMVHCVVLKKLSLSLAAQSIQAKLDHIAQKLPEVVRLTTHEDCTKLFEYLDMVPPSASIPYGKVTAAALMKATKEPGVRDLNKAWDGIRSMVEDAPQHVTTTADLFEKLGVCSHSGTEICSIRAEGNAMLKSFQVAQKGSLTSVLRVVVHCAAIQALFGKNSSDEEYTAEAAKSAIETAETYSVEIVPLILKAAQLMN